jgi:hypothetical protein
VSRLAKQALTAWLRLGGRGRVARAAQREHLPYHQYAIPTVIRWQADPACGGRRRPESMGAERWCLVLSLLVAHGMLKDAGLVLGVLERDRVIVAWQSEIQG